MEGPKCKRSSLKKTQAHIPRWFGARLGDYMLRPTHCNSAYINLPGRFVAYTHGSSIQSLQKELSRLGLWTQPGVLLTYSIIDREVFFAACKLMT